MPLPLLPRLQRPDRSRGRSRRRAQRKPRDSPRRCPPRTARCSRCPTRAPSSGISRTRRGSSRRSSSSASRATTGRSIALSRAVQFVLQRRRRQAPASRARARCRGPPCDGARISRARRRAMHALLGDPNGRGGSRPRRARPQPRAAAPGADPHRREAPASRNPCSRCTAPWPLTAVARAQPSTWTRSKAASAQSGTPATASRSTTSARAIGVRRAVRTRLAAGHATASSRVHRRRRISPARAWLSMGWDARPARGWQAPLYWEREGERWRTFTLHGSAAIDPDAPVCHVSYFEADAYRALGAGHACRPSSNGRSPRADRCRRRQFPRERRCTRSCRRQLDAQRRYSATSGNGPERYAPYPVFVGGGASASTTASSCAVSSCCAAASARRPDPPPRDVPEFLPAGGALAVLRPSPCARWCARVATCCDCAASRIMAAA